MRILRRVSAVSAGLLLLTISWLPLRADPPAQGAGPAAEGQIAEIKGGFMSTFSQAFKEDFSREVVRGHFDVGTSPNTRRYYCLYDPKKSRNTPNAVTGKLEPRRDGMTGITGGAVTPLSCDDAEKKGFLVTSGYLVNGPPARAGAAAAPAAAPVPAAAAATAVAASAAPAAEPSPAPAASVAPPAASVRSEVMAVFDRFLAAHNAHDRAGVAAVLLDSGDFLWAQYAGNSIWGTRQALDALEHDWRGISRLDPQNAEARVASPGPDVAVLVVPVLFTEAAPGASPAMAPIRWSGVFVRTRSGWRIASILVTPFKEWRAPGG